MPFHRLSDRSLAALPLVPAVALSIHVATHPVLEQGLKRQLFLSVVLSMVGFVLCKRLIARLMPIVGKKLSGKDLCKVGTRMEAKNIPESLGIASGTVYLLCIIITQVFHASSPEKSLDFSAALLSVCFAMFLGFADDVLDLSYGDRIIMTFFASLPLVCGYRGLTGVVLPAAVRPLLSVDGQLTVLGEGLNLLVSVQGEGAILELGYFIHAIFVLITIFCTQSINIYAGINGLEAGQSFIIGCSILTFNLCEICKENGAESDSRHLLSLLLIIPFTATVLALLSFNWYPSSVFVGDTFCYFAGMTFAVCGVVGHFPKTLMLFFLPQLLNFVLSIPQLFKVVPCPRHRLPAYNPQKGVLLPSLILGHARYTGREPTPKQEEQLQGWPNFTLINMFLFVFGPMDERALATLLLVFQVLCSCLGFSIRYFLPLYLYHGGN
jgi:UDP-N-acetylglucosamine--dolichyl-phosphate N-acetylglucosaminephosphotransferase